MSDRSEAGAGRSLLSADLAVDEVIVNAAISAVCKGMDAMKLTFLGTRGFTKSRSEKHAMHTSLGVEYYGRRVMVDCGSDWLGRLDEVGPNSIVITHAHPDHAFGLQNGAPCPVYATAATWEGMAAYPLKAPRLVEARRPFDLYGITFEAFPVEHSINAPAVGYRISAGRVAIFYVPDVVYIHDREDALSSVRLYIGDGATLTTSFVRKSGESLIGHSPVRTQLTWCQKFGIHRAVISHCGEEIVAADHEEIAESVGAMAAEREVTAQVAYDGMEIVLR